MTTSGRAAISVILEALGLERRDEVCVFTTFDFPNVSSCVTSTIFNYCKPSRVMTADTRAALVIHEFGVPFRDLGALASECRRRSIPLVEDCAHTINSVGGGRMVGTTGDWVVCSLPKIFPTLRGGVLLGPPLDYSPSARESSEIAAAVQEVGQYVGELDALSSRRREAYRGMTAQAGAVGLAPLFEVTDEITPWFFPLPVPDPQLAMDEAERAGVECALWHGTNVVVFPCHQYLGDEDVELFGLLVKRAVG